MGNRQKNRFKYECYHCGWTGFFHIQEFSRRSRPRCGACGSISLDPVTKSAKDRIADHDELAREKKIRNLKTQNFEIGPKGTFG